MKLHITTAQVFACSFWLATTAATAQPTGAASAAALASSEAELARMSAEQESLFSKLKQQVADLPADYPQREQKLRQLAAIEKRIYEESHVRYISRQTTGLWSGYRDAVRHRLEQYGTEHFPRADGHKLFGRLVLNLTVDQTGCMVKAEVVRSSGSTLLDQQALEIAGAAGPFAPFDDAMRKDAMRVVLTESFDFAHVD